MVINIVVLFVDPQRKRMTVRDPPIGAIFEFAVALNHCVIFFLFVWCQWLCFMVVKCLVLSLVEEEPGT